MTSHECVSPLLGRRPLLPSNVGENGYFTHNVIQITAMPYELNAIRHQHPPNFYLHPVATTGQRPLAQRGSAPEGLFLHKALQHGVGYRARKGENNEICAPTSSQRRCNIDDEYGDDVPIQPRISHWHSSAATKLRQTNRNYVTGKSPRISRLTRPAGWLACRYWWDCSLLSESKENKIKRKMYSLYKVQDNVLGLSPITITISCQQMTSTLLPYTWHNPRGCLSQDAARWYNYRILHRNLAFRSWQWLWSMEDNSK